MVPVSAEPLAVATVPARWIHGRRCRAGVTATNGGSGGEVGATAGLEAPATAGDISKVGKAVSLGGLTAFTAVTGHPVTASFLAMGFVSNITLNASAFAHVATDVASLTGGAGLSQAQIGQAQLLGLGFVPN